jgi:hypothetical protein
MCMTNAWSVHSIWEANRRQQTVAFESCKREGGKCEWRVIGPIAAGRETARGGQEGRVDESEQWDAHPHGMVPMSRGPMAKAEWLPPLPSLPFLCPVTGLLFWREREREHPTMDGSMVFLHCVRISISAAVKSGAELSLEDIRQRTDLFLNEIHPRCRVMIWQCAG